MTLRQILMTADLEKSFQLINKKDSNNAAACDRPSMEQTVGSYTKVVQELLSKPRARAYHLKWLIQESSDPFDGHKYADVCFLNPKYVAPKKGLKPWGCKRGQKPPKGHYNCNDNKHNKTFAAGFVPWSKVIDTPVINETNYPLEKVVAEMLWEITFYGWTEKRVEENVKNIEGKLKKAEKEIKEGKCIELLPKKKGGYTVVIPDSVSQQMIDIANKYSKKEVKKSP